MSTPRNCKIFGWDNLIQTGIRFQRICKFGLEQASLGVDYKLTSFASFKFWAGYIRKALIATRMSPKSPRQISVNPPEATAILSRFWSPVESTAEVGSRWIALHTSPRAITRFTFCESRERYAFGEVRTQDFRRDGYFYTPDRFCRRISPDPLEKVREHSAPGPWW